MFPYNVYLLAILSAFILALGTTPLWEKLCLRLGLVDDPGHRKIHDRPIPLAGGLAVLTAVMLPTLVASVVLWLQAPKPESQPDSTGAQGGPARSVHIVPLDPNSVFLLEHGFGVR